MLSHKHVSHANDGQIEWELLFLYMLTQLCEQVPFEMDKRKNCLLYPFKLTHHDVQCSMNDVHICCNANTFFNDWKLKTCDLQLVSICEWTFEYLDLYERIHMCCACVCVYSLMRTSPVYILVNLYYARTHKWMSHSIYGSIVSLLLPLALTLFLLPSSCELIWL